MRRIAIKKLGQRIEGFSQQVDHELSRRSPHLYAANVAEASADATPATGSELPPDDQDDLDPERWDGMN